jgi:aryl-alcohol dehydrogenase-like predicted oxidoreductase
VLASERFISIQVPFSMAQPSAGYAVTGPQFDDQGQIFADCERHGVSVLAIRVFAGGALTRQPPSAHTLRTPFFPLAAFERDRQLADCIEAALPHELSLAEAAVRFVVGCQAVTSAIVGMAGREQVEEAVRYANRGPLPGDVVERILIAVQSVTSEAAP